MENIHETLFCGTVKKQSANEDLADQPYLPADERQPIEMYHQLIQQHKRLICSMIS